MNILETFSSLGFPVIGIAALITYYFDRRKAEEEHRAADRREHYRTIILCLKNLRDGQADHIDLLKFEYAFLWLYAPYSVIESAGALIDTINKTDCPFDELAPKINELILQMRRDMGFGRTPLSAAPSRLF